MGRLFLLILYHFSDNPFVSVFLNPHVEPFKSREQIGAPDKPCGVGRADANPKLLLNDT